MSVRIKVFNLNLKLNLNKNRKVEKRRISIEFGKARKVEFENRLVSEMAIVCCVNYISKLIYMLLKAVDDFCFFLTENT